jgi:two-component system, response regulator PdtaR
VNQSLRIAVATDDPAVCRFYESALARLGHHVCSSHSGRQLVDQCRLLRPDLVIVRVGLLDPEGIDAAEEVCRDHPTPIILVAGGQEAGSVERICRNQYILACLFGPVEEANLGAVISVVMSRFERLRSLNSEVADLRQALADRKVIERAKGAVAKYVGLGEEQAYRSMRKPASDQNRKLVEVAQAVLAAGDVFHHLERAVEVQNSHDRPAQDSKRGRPHRNGDGTVLAERKADHAG